MVEMGVLLDLFVAVFVMGITMHQISREFDDLDVSRLSQLRDLPAGTGVPTGEPREN
jgi:hydrogenase-4 component E